MEISSSANATLGVASAQASECRWTDRQTDGGTDGGRAKPPRDNFSFRPKKANFQFPGADLQALGG